MKHIIGPVELYAIVAKHVWHGKTIFFIDSYVAMDSCIRGRHRTRSYEGFFYQWRRLTLVGMLGDGTASRVPSKSNPADEPSRGVFDGILAALNADRDQCSCPIAGIALSDLESPFDRT